MKKLHLSTSNGVRCGNESAWTAGRYTSDLHQVTCLRCLECVRVEYWFNSLSLELITDKARRGGKKA